MHSAKRDKAHGTGGIKESNAGGFKHGGKAHKMHHKATGGAIPAATMKGKQEGHFKHDTVEGGDWENRSADTATAGKKMGHTGEVHESNAGGYKHGGHAAKKHYATGGNVVDDGKAVKMPHHFVSRPVANSLQSGTFKKGGRATKKFDGGGSTSDDQFAQKANQDYANWEKAQRAENEADKNMIPNAIKSGVNAIKNLFSSKETPKAPAKKRGGSMRKC